MIASFIDKAPIGHYTKYTCMHMHTCAHKHTHKYPYKLITYIYINFLDKILFNTLIFKKFSKKSTWALLVFFKTQIFSLTAKDMEEHKFLTFASHSYWQKKKTEQFWTFKFIEEW